jgi:hypothetical protein
VGPKADPFETVGYVEERQHSFDHPVFLRGGDRGGSVGVEQRSQRRMHAGLVPYVIRRRNDCAFGFSVALGSAIRVTSRLRSMVRLGESGADASDTIHGG